MKNLGTMKLVSCSNPTMDGALGKTLWVFLTEGCLFAVFAKGEAYSFRTTQVQHHHIVGDKLICITRSGSTYTFVRDSHPACQSEAELFTRLYLRFERAYNPYPVQMSRADAFRAARKDHLITMEMFEAAEDVYGDLWSYVGD